MSRVLALYPGTFDPVTFGHLDLIRRGAALFGSLEVCVSVAGKHTHFSLDERLALLEDAVGTMENVTVAPFSGLLVAYAAERGARVLVRGVRGVRDLEYELEMAFANRKLAPEVETVFLAPAPDVALVSSTLVREVASLGGNVAAWVPPAAAKALRARPPAPPRPA